MAKKSNFGTISPSDIWKGLLVAVITSIVTTLYNALNTGTFDFTWLFWKPTLMTAVAAGLAYIIKNWLTNSEDKFAKAETR